MKQKNYYKLFPFVIKECGDFEMACYACMLADFVSGKLIKKALNKFGGNLKKLYKYVANLSIPIWKQDFYIEVPRELWWDIEKTKEFLREAFEKKIVDFKYFDKSNS